jgi:hypothetical protein
VLPAADMERTSTCVVMDSAQGISVWTEFQLNTDTDEFTQGHGSHCVGWCIRACPSGSKGLESKTVYEQPPVPGPQTLLSNTIGR